MQNFLGQRQILIFIVSHFLGTNCLFADYRSFPSVNNAVLSELSYSELASSWTYPAYAQLIIDLGAFENATLPHEAKTLRQQIGELRDYLDIFVFAFESHVPFDVWKQLRKDLDRGYAIIGKFKDLFDMQETEPHQATYDDEKVHLQRKIALAWIRKFRQPRRVMLNALFLKTPQRGKIYPHPPADISRFYWGGGEIVPQEEYGVLENVAALIRLQAALAYEDYIYVKRMPDVLQQQNEMIFHDLRKRLRTILKLINYFPGILIDRSTESSERYEKLVATVSKYGSLNDKISRYHLFQQEKRDRKAAQLAKEIAEQFAELKIWQAAYDMQTGVQGIVGGLLPPPR